MLNTSRRLTFTTATLLATGLGLLTAFVVIWLSAITYQWLFGTVIPPHENVVVTTQGEVLISRTTYDHRLSKVTYRNLAGEAIEHEKPISFLDRVAFAEKIRAENLSFDSEPLRIDSFVDQQTPYQIWFLISHRRRPQSAYFEVFDGVTQQRKFFVGLNGPTSTRPNQAEQFRINQQSDTLISGQSQVFRFHDMAASTVNVQTETTGFLKTHCLLRTTDQGVLQIHLRDGTVDSFDDRTEITHVSHRYLLPTQMNPSLLQPAEASTPQTGAEKSSNEGSRYWLGLFVKTDTEIQWRHFDSDKRLTFSLPEFLQNRGLNATILNPDRLLIEVSNEDKTTGKTSEDLYWLDRQGHVIDQQLAVVTGWNSRFPFIQGAFYNALLQPASLLFTTQYGFIGCLAGINERGLTVAQTWGRLLPILLVGNLVLLAVSFGLCLLYKRQSETRRCPVPLWHLLVIYAFGLFGYLILYWHLPYRISRNHSSSEKNGIDILKTATAAVPVHV